MPKGHQWDVCVAFGTNCVAIVVGVGHRERVDGRQAATGTYIYCQWSSDSRTSPLLVMYTCGVSTNLTRASCLCLVPNLQERGAAEVRWSCSESQVGTRALELPDPHISGMFHNSAPSYGIFFWHSAWHWHWHPFRASFSSSAHCAITPSDERLRTHGAGHGYKCVGVGMTDLGHSSHLFDLKNNHGLTISSCSWSQQCMCLIISSQRPPLKPPRQESVRSRYMRAQIPIAFLHRLGWGMCR